MPPTGYAGDTIYALSSGALPAGIAVVRVSGPGALLAMVALAGAVPPARMATLRTLRDSSGDPIDTALVLAFPAPASATGEDVAEFHVHGGVAVVAALLAALGKLPGLRGARPGEFARRAFDNGRLDLTRAEGLADLVAAETEAQRRAALALAGGALGRAAATWREALLDLAADAAASLDFAEAEDDVAARLDDRAGAALAALRRKVDAALGDAPRARALRDGLTVVVSGPPNVGKSSMVNALARREVAIVTPVPGTTRDAIEVRLDLGGVLVTLVDTAGLRDTDDPVEAEGIARARARAATADLVLALHCGDGAPGPGLPVRTKADLGGDGPGLAVSALTGQGIAALTDHLAEWARTAVRPEEPPLLTSDRQYAAVDGVAFALGEAEAASDPVLRAESLRRALSALAELTGQSGVEEVLDRVFDRFCIGK